MGESALLGPVSCHRAVLALATKHFVAIGAHACDSCRLLKSVDLCNNVEKIPEFAFVHCTSLREVLLPTLHTNRVNCTVFSGLAKMGAPLVLDENKPFWPQQARSRSCSSKVWARALA